jgi:hypothetical protein
MTDVNNEVRQLNIDELDKVTGGHSAIYNLTVEIGKIAVGATTSGDNDVCLSPGCGGFGLPGR